MYIFVLFDKILYNSNYVEGTNVKHVDIYTDGACKGNPGVGGYGVILSYNGKTKELSEGYPDTTNNRMELLAVIVGLEALKEPCDVTLYSDSKYVIDALTLGWVESWKSRGWIKSDRKKALNVDLWERLLAAKERHTVKYEWVKGHAGNPFNERCDKLAVLAAEKVLSEKFVQ